jgi:hypothetical protein
MHQPIKIRVRQIQDLCGFMQSEDLSVERDADTVASQSIALFIFLEVGDGFFKGEAFVVTHPVEGCWSINPSFSAGGCQRHLPSLPQDKDAVALHASPSWHPLGIFRAIGAVRIYAIILCPRKPSGLPIGQEVDETLRTAPAITDCYPGSTPMFVSSRVGIIATIMHLEPCPINGRRIACMSMPEGECVLSAASAALCVSAAQMSRLSNYFLSAGWASAVASTNPSRIPVIWIRGWSAAENSQISEYLASEVDKFTHGSHPVKDPCPLRNVRNSSIEHRRESPWLLRRDISDELDQLFLPTFLSRHRKHAGTYAPVFGRN